MPLYEYENPKTGERAELFRQVNDRDCAPSGFRRVTVPRRVYVWQDAPDRRDVDYATALAFKDMERKGVSTREMEKASGMSTEKIKSLYKKEINRLWVLLALLALFLLAGPLRAADITPGYTFVSGETVTHTKLNNAAAGTIGVSFFTGKSGNVNPTNDSVILIYNPVTLQFEVTTLLQGIFDSVHLVGLQNTNTATADDWFLFYDTTGGLNYRSTVGNMLSPLFGTQTLITNTPGSSQVLVYDGTNYNRTGITNLLTNVVSSSLSITSAPTHTTLTNLDKFLVWDSVTGTNNQLSAIGVFTNWAGNTNVAGSDTVVLVRDTNAFEVAMSNVVSYMGSNLVVKFTGTNHTFGTNQIFTNAHGLGGMPNTFEWRAVCLTNDQGYLAGEEVLPGAVYGFTGADTVPGVFQWADSTNVYVRVTPYAPLILDRTGAQATLTTNRWRLKPYAVRFP